MLAIELGSHTTQTVNATARHIVISAQGGVQVVLTIGGKVKDYCIVIWKYTNWNDEWNAMPVPRGSGKYAERAVQSTKGTKTGARPSRTDRNRKRRLRGAERRAGDGAESIDASVQPPPETRLEWSTRRRSSRARARADIAAVQDVTQLYDHMTAGHSACPASVGGSPAVR